MIPALPVAGVRAAIADEDWDLADALLRDHHAAVIAACAGPGFAAAPRGPWQALVEAQRALADEIRSARDEAGRALDKLGQDKRGARAWRQALA